MTSVTLPIEQLGLGASAAAKAVECGIRDAQSLASLSADELLDLGFTERHLANIDRCLDLVGLSLTVTQSHASRVVPSSDEGGGASLEFAATLVEEARTVVPETAPVGALIDDGYDVPHFFRETQIAEEPAVPRSSRRSRTDAERARKAASAALKGPSRNDPRVAALRESITMDVSDAAYLYGVSPDVIYDACRKPTGLDIPHQKFGTRIRIVTRHVFAQLGLD